MQLLDLRTAAARLSISPETLRRWARAGRVPCVRLGRRLLFDEDAMREWVARHKYLGS